MAMANEVVFLDQVLYFIQKEDPLHSKKVKKNIDELVSTYNDRFYNILSLLHKFFGGRNLSAEKIAGDYLKMIKDMRIEGMQFKKTKQYSCLNQHDAYLNVYSKADVMAY